MAYPAWHWEPTSLDAHDQDLISVLYFRGVSNPTRALHVLGKDFCHAFAPDEKALPPPPPNLPEPPFTPLVTHEELASGY